jgi:hypothetical protein
MGTNDGVEEENKMSNLFALIPVLLCLGVSVRCCSFFCELTVQDEGYDTWLDITWVLFVRFMAFWQIHHLDWLVPCPSSFDKACHLDLYGPRV